MNHQEKAAYGFCARLLVLLLPLCGCLVGYLIGRLF